MNIDRLTKLADLLDTVPVDKFDLNYWGEARTRYSPAPEHLDIAKDECGTTACACGWACTIPEFREAGLHLELVSSVWRPSYDLVYEKTELDRLPMGKVTYTNLSAAAAFFDLSRDAAERLFYPDSYFRPEDWDDPDRDGYATTPAEVAARIRELIAPHTGEM